MTECGAAEDYGHECRETERHPGTHRCGLVDAHSGTVCAVEWAAGREAEATQVNFNPPDGDPGSVAAEAR